MIHELEPGREYVISRELSVPIQFDKVQINVDGFMLLFENQGPIGDFVRYMEGRIENAV